jgi:Tfp pilus assembly protein PilV
MIRFKKTKLGSGESGVTLIETMLAVVMLLVPAVGLMGVFSFARVQTVGQGDWATRATEYSQDKLESLMALSFTDPGLGGNMAANSTVGSSNTSAPVNQYVDYVDQNGTISTSSTGAMYTRAWSIATGSSTNLKTITVTTTSAVRPGGMGTAPTTTLVCVKSNR